MELPTTVTARAIDAPYVLPLADPPTESVAGPPCTDIDDQASGAAG
jgi:hypothetical protein